MRIYFSKNTSNTSGGGLNEPFYHFGRIISDKFQSENITFPYGEIEICLAFSSSNEKNQQRKEWFEKLPHYYRGKTMLRVTLPMLEKEKNLTDMLAVIDSAFEIIISKKKKDDAYDAQKLREVLSQLGKELHEADLLELSAKYEKLIKQETIQENTQARTAREQSNHEKKKLIYDLRFMYYLPNIDRLHFSPHDYEICGRILEKLREKKFRLPIYTHLYVMVAETFEKALLHATSPTEWFVYGVAVLEDYESYSRKKEVEKQRIVFDLIKEGLNDIAKIDKLDMKTLEETLNEVEQELFK